MAERFEILIIAKDEASKVLGSIGNAAKNVFGIGLGVATAAVGGLTAAIGLSMKEAMDAQGIQAQLAAVIESTGGAAGVTAGMANDLATKYSLLTRFSDDAIVSGENMLLTFTNIGKDVFPEATQTMLDMSQALGQDLKASSIQLGKALNDPVAGVTALRRVGVTFTEEQQNMINKLVESGDLLGAQKVVLAELKKEFGGSAEAAGKTFAGQLDILKNSLLNVAEGVGTSLLPPLQQLFNDVILPALPAITEFAALFGQLVAGFIEGGASSTQFQDALANMFGAETASSILDIINKITEVAGVIQTFIMEQVVPFIQEHSEEFKGALAGIAIAIGALGIIGLIMSIGSAIAALASPIGIIMALAALLGAAWAGNWGGIRDTLTNFWNTTGKPIFDQVVAWLQVNIPKAIQILTDFWNNTLLPVIRTVWKFLTVDMMPVWKALGELLGVIIKKDIEILTGIWQNILQPALKAIWEFIKDKIVPIFKGMSDSVGGVSGAIEKVVGWITSLTEKLASVKLPSWLTPGSPTPLELGLLGIGRALDDLVTVRLDNFRVDLEHLPSGVSMGGGTTTTNNNYNLTINEAGDRGNIVQDFYLMKALA